MRGCSAAGELGVPELLNRPRGRTKGPRSGEWVVYLIVRTAGATEGNVRVDRQQISVGQQGPSLFCVLVEFSFVATRGVEDGPSQCGRVEQGRLSCGYS